MIIAIIIAAVLAIGAAVYFFVIKKSSPPATVVPVSSDWVISGTHDSQPVTLKANAVHGGAVYSLVWGGTEFIDATDNGRELQTAWQENNLGEGRNPTEAGASADGTPASHSTTVVTAYNATGNILRTQAQLAYWFPYNGATLSPQKLSKTVTIGYNGLDNVIHHQITITLAEALQDINVEGLTSYSPPSFTRFFVYDLATSKTTELSGVIEMNYNQKNPTIVANADLSRALVLYGPTNLYHYGGTSQATQIAKLDCSSYQVHGPVAAGDYSWECFTIFGTFTEVVDTLSKLKAM